MNDDTGSDLREEVRSRYAGAALAVLSQSGEAAGCCDETGGCCAPAGLSALTEGPDASLYREGETDGLPAEAVAASLGCGNPLAVAGFAQTSVTFAHEAAPGMHSAVIRAVKPSA